MSRTDQQPLNPIPQMTTYELTELRRALEETLAMESREELQQQLSEVIAEQDERTRIRRANAHA